MLRANQDTYNSPKALRHALYKFVSFNKVLTDQLGIKVELIILQDETKYSLLAFTF